MKWQPPHPDPAKLGIPQDGDIHPRAAFRKCIFPGCAEYEEPNYAVRLCGPHAQAVRRRLNAYDRETLALKDRRKEEREQTKVATADKIDAGQRLNAGDIVPGWLYYLLLDGVIKIGYASNVRSRMSDYPPTAKLLAVEPGTPKLERARHDHFHAYLAHGREWFRDAPELREWIDTLTAKYGKPTAMEYHYSTPSTQTSHKRWRGTRKTAA